MSAAASRSTPTQDFSEHNLVTLERDSLYLGWTEPGEWVHYTVLVAKTGQHLVRIRFLAGNTNLDDLELGRR